MSRDEYSCCEYEIERPEEGFEYTLEDADGDVGLELQNFRVFDEAKNVFKEAFPDRDPSIDLDCFATWDPDALLENLVEDRGGTPNGNGDEDWTGYSVGP